MAKKKPVITIRSYGIYSQWDSKSKDLPKVKEFTTDIPAEIDVEFGLIINIKSARGKKIIFTIDHPGIYDDAGKLRDPFTGIVHITNNDWSFYLGDTIWAPMADKIGFWKMSIELDNEIIVDKTFNILSDNDNSKSLLKKRFTYL